MHSTCIPHITARITKVSNELAYQIELTLLVCSYKMSECSFQVIMKLGIGSLVHYYTLAS